jgi:hypothetical protein
MAENEKKEPLKVEIFKPDTIIKLELPVTYVERFNQFLLDFIPFRDEEHFQEVMKKIADKKEDDDFSYHTTTLMSFLALCEQAARKQGHLEVIDIDRETGDRIQVSED